MPKLSMGQAAKHAGVSKTSLSRWIKRGKISAEKQDDGSYLIDPSELDRILSEKERGNARNSNRDSNSNPKGLQNETPDGTPKSNPVTQESDRESRAEIEILREKVKLREEKISEQKEQIADLKTDRDRWRDQAERLAITYKPPATTQTPVQHDSGESGSRTPNQQDKLLHWLQIVALAITIGVVIGLTAHFSKEG